jgi:hypothetical protein
MSVDKCDHPFKGFGLDAAVAFELHRGELFQIFVEHQVSS